MNATLRRELRVAFSLRAQSLPFRIGKWAVFVTLAIVFRNKPWFWWCATFVAFAGLCLHLLYRHKTARWTQPWGGWNDLEIANPPHPSSPAQPAPDIPV
jgi:hypothetical protein